MKKVTIITMILFLALCLSGQDPKKPESDKDKASYVVGYNMGLNLKALEADLDMKILLQGLRDAVQKGSSPIMSKEELKEVFQKFIEESRKRKEERLEKLAKENKAKGEAFLKENAGKAGITVTESGLQYEILTKGSGATPGDEDMVELHYKGTHLNGEEFHNSYKRGKPVTFQVKRTYKGWKEALKMMKAGGKWRLYLAPELAFGHMGLGNLVGANEVVIFELELLAVKPPAKPKKPTPKKK